MDDDILGGTPVFSGTRVPVRTLFGYLEDNYTLEEFLECFPTLTREMAVRMLDQALAFSFTTTMARRRKSPGPLSANYRRRSKASNRSNLTR